MKLMVAAAIALVATGCASEPKRVDTSAGVGQAAPSGGATTAAVWHAQHATLFERTWGVDVVGVRRISSGQMLRFSYRILDPVKAKPLQAKEVKPYLTDEATGTRLAVPALENVGELRQTAAPEAGRTYFMIFGNPGGLVKSGSPVDVVIGGFHAEGLIVD
jgi:hypothetical protein